MNDDQGEIERCSGVHVESGARNDREVCCVSLDQRDDVDDGVSSNLVDDIEFEVKVKGMGDVLLSSRFF